MQLEQEQCDKLWPLTEGRRVSKTRYEVPFGERVIEVDVYEGGNKGLTVAEVEFSDEKECLHFQPPDWLGEDVSGDEPYKNRNLASEGRR